MNCIVLIFSKDRALQLDATLRSFLLHCQDVSSSDVRILYTTTTPLHAEQYRQLEKEYQRYTFLQFIHEQNFYSDAIALLAPSDYVLFLVDDNIFVRDFSLSEVIESLQKHTDALGFSLRLGRNTTYCYPLDKAQQLPDFQTIDNGMLKFNWTVGERDFGYPLEVSSSLYRVEDILSFIAQLAFRNPNTLEALMAERSAFFRNGMPYFLCFEQSATFCAPINMVQTMWTNRASKKIEYSPDSLAKLFDDGLKIDISAYDNFIPNACHQEVELKLVEPAKTDKEQQPMVSVIIPCYNQACYLPEVVESVVSQTYHDWECIIVNDGSPDNTTQVAEELIKRYPSKKIRLVVQENQGVSSARNNGIKSSQGKYILPLDADDSIYPEMLQKTVALLETHPEIAIAYTDVLYFGARNAVIQAGEWDFDRLRFQNHLNYCSLYCREVWETVGGYNTNMVLGWEDWDFWIGCGEKGFRGERIPEPLFMYRVKESSRDTNAAKHGAELKAQIILNHPDLYDENTKGWARHVLANVLHQQVKTDSKEVKCSTPQHKPVVSVIVPTYNRPDMLAETLQSILNQTYQNFEIVVVNDAGIDVSHVIENYNQSGKIVYLQHEKNKGLAASRNTGARAAKGKYINYLDDDDIFYPDHLQTLVELLESGEYKVAYADAQRAIQEKENDKFVTKYKDVPYSFDFDYDRILLTNFIPVLCIMHEKSCLNEVGYFDETLKAHEDWDLWMRMSRKFKFAHIKKVTCEFRWREDVSNMTFRNKDDMDTTREIVFQRGMKYSMMDFETKIEDKFEDKTDLPRPKKRKDDAQSLLFIVHSSPLNNMEETENYTYHLARELHNRGNEVQILYPEYDATRPFGIVTEYTHEGLSVTSMNVHPPQNFVEQFLNEQIGNAFRNYVSKLDVDLVHFHHFIGFSASPLQVCVQMGIPAVVTLHDEWMLCEQYFYLHVDGSYCSEGPETVEKCVQCFLSRHSEMDLMQYIQELYQVFTLRRQYLQNVLQWIDTLIVPSKFLQEELKKHGFHHPKTLLIPLGLYTFNPLPWELQEGLLRFSYVGNINFTKGLDLIIHALNMLNTDNIQLNIFGNIQDLAYFKQVMNTSFKRQVIKHHGPYKPEDLPGIFSQTDVAIIPSRSENYPFIVRECLHADVPVIASNVGGIPEIIQDGVNGFLFKQGDFRDLANKLQFIIQNPQKILALRKNIQPVRTVKEDVEELKGIYREVLARKMKSK